MLTLLAIATLLAVLLDPSRRSRYSDPNTLHIFPILAAIAGAIGSAATAVGTAAGAVGGAITGAAGAIGGGLLKGLGMMGKLMGAGGASTAAPVGTGTVLAPTAAAAAPVGAGTVLAPAASAPAWTAPTFGSLVSGAPAASAAPAAATSAPTSMMGSVGKFMQTPYGKMATKMLTGGGGGEKQESTTSRIMGGIGGATNQYTADRKRQQLAALVSSGMSPELARSIVGE